MNWEVFSPIGYASLVLMGCVPLLWLAHVLIRPRKWLGHVALVCGAAGLLLATVNSKTYVSRIQVDQTEVVQKQLAARDLARQQAEAERAKDVANITFAEDAAGDRLDKAGLDDTDLAYFESFDDDTPDWKQQKQTRGEDAGEDDDLQAMIGGTTEREGVEVEGMEEAKQREPIFLSEADMLTANRLDKAGLTTAKVLLLLAALFVVVDYVRRLNVYREAYFPLPIPSRWADALTERPGVSEHPDKPRRSMQDELRFITRRGEVFLYFTDDADAAAQAVEPMPRLPAGRWPITVLNLKEQADLDDRFVFETLWFARNSFVVEDADRALRLLDAFVNWLTLRRDARARTRCAVHLVWDLPIEVPEPIRQRLEILGKATGYTLLICRKPALGKAAA